MVYSLGGFCKILKKIMAIHVFISCNPVRIERIGVALPLLHVVVRSIGEGANKRRDLSASKLKEPSLRFMSK